MYDMSYKIEKKKPASPASLCFLLINFGPPPQNESNHPKHLTKHLISVPKHQTFNINDTQD